MNKKGFTTVELILTIVLVVIIMGTITSVTYTYRDRSEYEKLITEVTNYKNTLTKIIQDDFINPSDPIVDMWHDEYETSFEFQTSLGRIVTLEIINDQANNQVGIKYDGVDYIIPGSQDDLVSFVGINKGEDYQNCLFSFDIIFRHRQLENDIKIHLLTNIPCGDS